MKIVVPIKLVPDLVEELSINDSGTALDMTWLRLIINEFDDHAIEQAILLKEKSEGSIIVIAPDAEGVDDMLFTAAAKGVDQVIKLIGDFEDGVNSHALARAFSDVIKELQPDIVLTGVQAHDDQDGSVGPLLAEFLGMPYIGYISGVDLENGKALAKKEYPGGLIGEMEIILPAVLGIQAAEQPPRYVAISKVRQASKTSSIDEREVTDLNQSGGPIIDRMFQPEAGERATMIDGNEEEIAAKLIEIFEELGVL
jgi:electron transfer flavoprotein beta subunit